MKNQCSGGRRGHQGMIFLVALWRSKCTHWTKYSTVCGTCVSPLSTMCDGQLLPPPSWSLGGWGLARVAPGLKHAVQSGCRAPRKAASHAKPAFLSREWLRAAVDCCWVSLLSSPAISKFADRRSSQLRRAGVNRNSASIPGNCREHRFGIFINYSGDPFPPRSNDQTRLQRAPLLKIKLPVTPSITKTSSWWGPTALGTTPPIRS